MSTDSAGTSCESADINFYTARVDYRVFERISEYDPKQEHGILARRKCKNTTDWIHPSEAFRALLQVDGPIFPVKVKMQQLLVKLTGLTVLLIIVGSGKSVLM
jgi:hypothetical protein